MNSRPFFSAILLCGGSGERFNSALPKQLHRISGKKIYLHTVDRFIASGLFSEIVVVAPAEYIDIFTADLAHYRTIPIAIVPGGSTRQQSSYRGICACRNESEYVVIHDGVRPFITEKILADNVDAVMVHDAVDTCIPSADTIVHSVAGDSIDAIPDRAQYLRGQTPQSFNKALIMTAHERALHDGIVNASDDCRLVLSYGHPVHIVDGDENNIKITTELDLFLAEQLFRVSTAAAPLHTPLSLSGKRYIVTGGTSGIGKAVCSLLENEGAIAIPLSRSSSPHAADLTRIEEIKTVLSAIGTVDGIVNNAAVLTTGLLKDMAEESIDEMVMVNLRGLIMCCKHAIISEGGHIVNIASSSFSRGRPSSAVYSATKAAVVNLTQALADEYSHLHVNAVIPQRTATPMRWKNFSDEKEDLLSPEYVANAVIEILKQKALTGQTIHIRKNPTEQIAPLLST